MLVQKTLGLVAMILGPEQVQTTIQLLTGNAMTLVLPLARGVAMCSGLMAKTRIVRTRTQRVRMVTQPTLSLTVALQLVRSLRNYSGTTNALKVLGDNGLANQFEQFAVSFAAKLLLKGSTKEKGVGKALVPSLPRSVMMSAKFSLANLKAKEELQEKE